MFTPVAPVPSCQRNVKSACKQPLTSASPPPMPVMDNPKIFPAKLCASAGLPELAVLLIDPHAVYSALAQGALSVLECQTTAVLDLDSGRAALAERDFDLVLVDSELVCSGAAALRSTGVAAVAPNFCRRPWIAFAAQVSAELLEQCLGAGLDGCVERPYAAAEFRALLEANCPARIADGEGAAPLEAVPAAPWLDTSALMQGVGGDERLVATILREYANSAPAILSALVGALAGNDAQSAFRAAHTLKSASGQIGAMRVAALAAGVESAARANDLAAAAAHLMELKTSFIATCEQLTSRLGDMLAQDVPGLAQMPSVPRSVPPDVAGQPDNLAATALAAHAVDAATCARHILVIDDDATTRVAVQQALSASGFLVSTSNGGVAALAWLEQHRPDLIILDIVMPGMDGFATCDAIRTQPRFALLPILMATGLDDLTAVERAFGVGATDFLIKPFNWTVLDHRLRYILRSSDGFTALTLSEARNRALLDAMPDLILRVAGDGRLLDNNGYRLGPDGKEPLIQRAHNIDELVPAAFAQALQAAAIDTMRARLPTSFDYRIVHGAAQRTYETRITPTAADEAIAIIQDVTSRIATETQVRMLSEAIARSANAVAIVDLAGKLIYANGSFEELSGMPLDEMRASGFSLRAFGEITTEGSAAIDVVFSQGGEWCGELCHRQVDGSEVWLLLTLASVTGTGDSASYLVATYQDITERKLRERHVHQLAYFDQLTGLPNRLLFHDRLARLIALSERQKSLVAVLFLDLDHFKRVNDTLGHDVGDALLKLVAERIGGGLRASDSLARSEPGDAASEQYAALSGVARLGGDEFTVILSDVRSAADAARVAQRLIDQLSLPFYLDRNEVFFGASVGIAMYPFDGLDPGTLLKNADTAMYAAKSQGRNGYEFYTRSMSEAALRRLDIENKLRRAIDGHEWVLHYQPKYDARSGAAIGVEALIRWNHPELGLVSPGEFIPVAEETGLIVAIGGWVLRQACQQAAQWRELGGTQLRIAINLSARQFRDQTLLATIVEAYSSAGLAPTLIDIEITESVLIDEVENAISILQRLRELGLRIAIDDFGTGYSSLSYLKRFPIDTLKIDCSFIKDIADDAEGAGIVQAIIDMAHSLNQVVVAEGVETAAQAAILREMGCDQLQGYFLSYPLGDQGVRDLLRGNRVAPGLAPQPEIVTTGRRALIERETQQLAHERKARAAS